VHNDAYKRCLEELDVPGMQKLWRATNPHLEQLDEIDTLTAIHYARTVAESVRFKLRAYSHAWLIERGYPSGLPDKLRPKAQQICPITTKVVGISVGMPEQKPTRFNIAVRDVMADAVLETYADGHQDQPEIVKGRMMEMRDWFKRGS
jgi:hypothetical protein